MLSAQSVTPLHGPSGIDLNGCLRLEFESVDRRDSIFDRDDGELSNDWLSDSVPSAGSACSSVRLRYVRRHSSALDRLDGRLRTFICQARVANAESCYIGVKR